MASRILTAKSGRLDDVFREIRGVRAISTAIYSKGIFKPGLCENPNPFLEGSLQDGEKKRKVNY